LRSWRIPLSSSTIRALLSAPRLFLEERLSVPGFPEAVLIEENAYFDLSTIYQSDLCN